MKKTLLFAIPAFAILLYLAPLWNLRLPLDEFPELSLPKDLNKRAMVVVAHDDDACAVAGLVYKLVQEGWDIDFVTFYISVEDGYRPAEIEVRKKELLAYAKGLGMGATHHTIFKMRKGRLDTIDAPYMPLPVAEFDEYFETDSLKSMLEAYIDQIRPSLVISLDDEFGGYGHPEHVLVSKTVSDICKERQMEPEFPVKLIYQVVISDKQELQIANLPVYKAGKKIYMTDGVPDPTVSLYVGDVTEAKMFGLSVWASQKRNIRKFFPYFQYYPHWIYFKVVDQEYYRVLNF